MISGAATVDAYLAEVAEARRPAMARLRELCRERLGGSEECIEYGMPCFRVIDELLRRNGESTAAPC